MPLFLIPYLLEARSVLSRYWPYILSALAAALLLYGAYSWSWYRGFHHRDAEVAALNGTIQNFKEASAKAQLDNQNHVKAVESAQDAVTKESNDDAPIQLAAARAALRDYIRLHPATKATPSYPSKDGLSEIPLSPGKSDETSSQAEVSASDLDACAVAYTTANGLQEWIKAQSEIER